jgi:hypothetical protein
MKFGFEPVTALATNGRAVNQFQHALLIELTQALL